MFRKAWFIPLTFLLATPAALATSYTIDSAHTYPQFEIRHLSFSLLHGRFNHTTGSITMDRAKKLGSVKVTIAVNSLDTGDAQRDKDLMAKDFFNVKKYPDMTYKSTKVVYHGKHEATVSGKLTLKGVTKPVKLDVTRIHCSKNPLGPGDRCGFDATANIKRSDFGVSADLPIVPDKVHLIINADALTQPAKKEQ
jgi:polyisoprenoid-binding protein YceI